MTEQPDWVGGQRVLLRGGNVYSPADPFATAMLVAGGEIAWIGSDGAALAMADGVDEVVELVGALVTPAFVDAWCTSGTDGAAHGVALQAWEGPAGSGPGTIRISHGDGVVGGIVEGARLLVASALDIADVPRLAAARLPVCLIPDNGLRDLPLAALAAAGVPMCFGSGGRPADPWETIAAAIHHPDDDQRISARAAFAAHTRGGWRALGWPGQGVLVPGAPAHYAVWQVADLVVQAPDDRIEAWSTDPRSGTPGLPDLSPGAPRPRCKRTAVWGRAVFNA